MPETLGFVEAAVATVEHAENALREVGDLIRRDTT
jgi:hypothetical protein